MAWGPVVLTAKCALLPALCEAPGTFSTSTHFNNENHRLTNMEVFLFIWLLLLSQGENLLTVTVNKSFQAKWLFLSLSSPLFLLNFYFLFIRWQLWNASKAIMRARTTLTLLVSRSSSTMEVINSWMIGVVCSAHLSLSFRTCLILFIRNVCYSHAYRPSLRPTSPPITLLRFPTELHCAAGFEWRLGTRGIIYNSDFIFIKKSMNKKKTKSHCFAYDSVEWKWDWIPKLYNR